ncbi:MAG: alpha-galactosidase, partial [Acidobacteria bacterium]|nr:alpha-galactosidase [Acidobacteriota bacterium]
MKRRSFLLSFPALPAFSGVQAPPKGFQLAHGGLVFDFTMLGGRLRQRLLLPAGYDPKQTVPAPKEASCLEVAIHAAGENRDDHHGSKCTGSMPGGRLVFVEKREERTSNGMRAVLVHTDPQLHLRVESYYEFSSSAPVARRYTRVVNEGQSPVGLEFVSSAMLHQFAELGKTGIEDKLTVHFAFNSWQQEAQWQHVPPSKLGLVENGMFPLNGIFFNNVGSWSTMKYLPMGMVENREAGLTWFWQIEHNGSWHWELSRASDGASYVYLGGPDDEHGHAWKNLQPGEAYETVPAAVGCVRGGFTEAVAAITRYRRAVCLHPHRDNRRCPVIFNDYMNCLMGDPTTEKELPLIDAAAAAGCEYFVIDAGWYAERKENWWDGVGLWQPSRTRWTGGLPALLGRIREKKLIPGLWLELEVAGIRSPLKDKPDAWFFQRHGKRVIDHGRYLLDFRNPEVRGHADEVIDRLVRQYGAGYIKMDYNVTAGEGTDYHADSAGQGMLEHQRAYLRWLDAVYQRYPDLVIENCGSGGGRMDYAMLSRHQLQSSSDQMDYRVPAYYEDG